MLYSDVINNDDSNLSRLINCMCYVVPVSVVYRHDRLSGEEEYNENHKTCH